MLRNKLSYAGVYPIPKMKLKPTISMTVSVSKFTGFYVSDAVGKLCA